MFKESEETKVVEMYPLEDSLNDADKVNMDVQKRSGTKDTSVPLPSVNSPISVAAPKPLSSNMNSGSVLPTIHSTLHNQMFTYRFH